MIARLESQASIYHASVASSLTRDSIVAREPSNGLTCFPPSFLVCYPIIACTCFCFLPSRSACNKHCNWCLPTCEQCSVAIGTPNATKLVIGSGKHLSADAMYFNASVDSNVRKTIVGNTHGIIRMHHPITRFQCMHNVVKSLSHSPSLFLPSPITPSLFRCSLFP
jgi:hypothetical protein